MENLKYIIIENKKNISSDEIAYLQRAYALWKGVWEPILKDTFTADAFSRQTYYCLLVQDKEVVAMTFNSTFDARLDATYDHSYFRHFPKSYHKKLSDLNPDLITTYESLTVRSDFRKKDIGILMIQLGMMFSKFLNTSLLLCPAMRVNGVNQLCLNSGFNKLLEEVEYKGHRIDLLYFKPEDDVITSSILFYRLWENRTDYSSVTTEKILDEQASFAV